MDSFDHALLSELARRELSRDEREFERQPFEFTALAQWAESMGQSVEGLRDSFELLEESGSVKLFRVLGGHPFRVQLTTSGLERVIADIDDDFARHQVECARMLVHGAERVGTALARTAQVPRPVVEHLLRKWSQKDWLLLSAGMGDLMVVQVKAGLRRWLEQALTETPGIPLSDEQAGAAEQLTLERAPRQWGMWIAVDERPFARSHMSHIWKVRRADGGSSEHFALKEIKYRTPSAAARARFSREISVLRSADLQHPNIIKIIDAHLPESDEQGVPFMVMPLASRSLDKVERRLRGNAEWALEVVVALTHALEASHKAGILHRDVKPANVLQVDGTEDLVLCDFGICLLTDEDRLTGEAAQTLGTRSFVAPELHGGGLNEVVSPASDVYSLGKTLYALISGDTLEREWITDPRFDLVLRYPGRRLEHVNALLQRMVTVNPSERYQDMAECRLQLQRALNNLRQGVPYRVGLYDERTAAVERYRHLERALTESSGVSRGDAILDVARDITERIRAICEDTSSGNSSEQAPELKDDLRECAAAAAEELLVLALSFIRHGEDERLSEWAAARRRDAAPENRGEGKPHDRVLALAAVTSVYVAAAYAWHRQRSSSLSLLVRALSSDPRRWIHLSLLEKRADQILPWITAVSSRMQLTQVVDRRFNDQVAECLQTVAGLTILFSVLHMSRSEFEQYLRDESSGVAVAAFPGYYGEGLGWVRTLLDFFSNGGAYSDALCTELLGLQRSDLPKNMQTITPAVRRSIARLAAESRRDSPWHFSGGIAWERWIGRVAS